MNRKVKTVFFLFLLSINLLTFFHLNNSPTQPTTQLVSFFPVNSELLQIHFIDVGNADSSLIIFPNNKTMLIDAGENDDEEKVVNYLQQCGISTINYLVGTHPHSDHIGSLDAVIKNFYIENIYMPKIPEKYTPSTKTYNDVLNAINDKNLKIHSPKINETINVAQSAQITFLNTPEEVISEEMNDYSIVLNISYNGFKITFTGDIEKSGEEEILNNFMQEELRTNLLKVAHHGSGTSSSSRWIRTLHPEYVFIPCGINNKYGHPHPNIIERFLQNNSAIYRSDENGNVIFVTDGYDVQIITEK